MYIYIYISLPVGVVGSSTACFFLREIHSPFSLVFSKLDVLSMAASGKLISNLNWTGNSGFSKEHAQQLAVGTDRWYP